MAVSRQRAHSVATLRGHARGWGQPGAGWGGVEKEEAQRGLRLGGKERGVKTEERAATLQSCHVRVTTTPLCLFELSFPISTNKLLCKDEQA